MRREGQMGGQSGGRVVSRKKRPTQTWYRQKH